MVSMLQQLKKPSNWQFALAFLWLALFVATHLPAGTPALPGDRVDKLIHALAYALLSGVFATTWELSAGRLMWRHLVWIWFIMAAYAAIDEGTQPLVGRDGNFPDWLADAAGAVVGLMVFALLRRFLAEARGGVR